MSARKGQRADLLLVERGLASSRAAAQAAIQAGRVHASGVAVTKPAQILAHDAHIEYAPAHPYVSRGALKLVGALDHFKISPAGLVCLDIGASTGGFTEVLLERGAEKIYALDVGFGQLHSKLGANPRVFVREGINARELTVKDISEAPQLITIDVSFIGLKLALPPALTLAAEGAHLIALVKPQFEVGRANIGKGGVVRDDVLRRAAVEDIMAWISSAHRWSVLGAMESSVAGGDGNREFFIAASKP